MKKHLILVMAMLFSFGLIFAQDEEALEEVIVTGTRAQRAATRPNRPAMTV